MELVVLGLNHKTAPVQLRERFAIPEERLTLTAQDVRDAGFAESFVVSTCNRVEFYGAAEKAPPLEAAVDLMADLGRASVNQLEPHLYSHQGKDAITHLFRVASSLDSMVVGEPQILGQLKVAFEQCRNAGVVGPALNRAVQRAFAVAKRVRTETGIGRQVVSISSIAVDLARQVFGDFSKRSVLLLGAGKMGELAARALTQSGVDRLLVANRSLERAERVAQALGGHPRTLAEIETILVQVDIVIASTGSRQFLVDAPLVSSVMKRRKYRPIFFVDIAVPRNIDPDINRLDNVYAYDIDDLHRIAQNNLDNRRQEAQAAEEMVADHANRFCKELTGDRVKPTIVELRHRMSVLRDDELARAIKKLRDPTPEQIRVLEQLVDGVMGKMLYSPMSYLKQSAGEADAEDAVRIVRGLFGLDDSGGEK